MNNDEQDLQQRFDAWSAQEHSAAPDFERMWRRAQRAAAEPKAAIGAKRLWPRVAVSVAMALLAAGIWWGTRDGAESWDAQLAAFESELDALPDSEPAAATWTAPTDFLLAAAPDQPLDNPRR